MSLYRQTRSAARLPIALGALAAAVALAVGFAAGRVTGDQPSLRRQLEDLRRQLEPAASGMGLVRITYPGDPAAGLAQAERAQAAFDRVDDDLGALYPAGTARARTAVEATVAAARRRAPAREVTTDAARAQAALEPLSGR